MPHCPQCGSPCGEGASACPTCGFELSGGAEAPGSRTPGTAGTPHALAPTASSRTMMGIAAPILPVAPPASAATPLGPGTIVGGPTPVIPIGGPSIEAPPSGASLANRTILGGMAAPAPSRSGGDDPARTVVGVASPTSALAGVPPSRARPDPAGSTMIGVAMPGIAPLGPDEQRDDAYVPAGELGATIAPHPQEVAWAAPQAQQRPRRRGAPPPVQAVAAPPRPPKRAVAIVIAAGVLATAAVLFALLWPSPPPLTARARVDAEGHEVVEVRCPSCPNGTKIAVGAASATIASSVAEVAVPAPLTVGENKLSVGIDRPGNGRDETVSVQVNVGYRIRPDLQTLQGEHPAIQIVIEAVPGTSVAIDGKTIPLLNGRAIETIDVTEACTGLSDDSATLSRQIPYAVTPKDAAPEQGTVNVSVRILPLHIDAPGPHAVVDGKNFVLAGRTLKGAEILAAGRPIPVRPDGSFAQTMNVSSVGATQIEVRARMAGAAPRITPIGVRRVDSLETAAKEFAAADPHPTGYAAVGADLAGNIGKPVILAGEVIEVRRQNHQTIMLLDVSPKSGCTSDKDKKGGSACHVRLVQGADNATLQRGDLITAYGRVSRAFSTAGQPDIAEVQVDFTLKGLR